MRLMEARIEKLEKQVRILTTGLGMIHTSTTPGLVWIDDNLKGLK